MSRQITISSKTPFILYVLYIHILFLREEAIQGVLIFSPVLVYLDPESEEYLLTEYVLQDEA